MANKTVDEQVPLRDQKQDDPFSDVILDKLNGGKIPAKRFDCAD